MNRPRHRVRDGPIKVVDAGYDDRVGSREQRQAPRYLQRDVLRDHLWALAAHAYLVGGRPTGCSSASKDLAGR